MHLYIKFTSQEDIEVPVRYNHLLQAALYETIDPPLAAFLHDKGYQSHGRSFKLFTFSRLNGKFKMIKEKNMLRFCGDICLTVTSPVADFCHSIANRLFKLGQIRLGRQSLDVKALTTRQYTVQSERVILRTLSPVVTYSTFLRPEGRKYTCYFQPGEPDYNQLIENNLRKKYLAFYQVEAPPGAVTVTALSPMKLNIVNYKDTVIKGYSGKLAITGPNELLQMAVDAGIGSKNSQGFGCVEVVEKQI
ncbi:CRISPR-associated endoribonuclease Cas6 [Desulforamulus ferrireducens]|uniref:CRISPR-associated endoribonuclease n=1 Tax=Desulforamulus ferrireducens TaxID=1833852 RepID=A0A1S6IUF8_9FIRM|nr:CRISPR-associated endoribonuclease Cas6 [Desulforamulus ferrireducens]AQS58400.1 CRISPR-associated endoribonuclease Cas6 [Desulforamulus ferrireducens]